MTAPVEALRRLSVRTPLRIKLITAVLGLVIMALIAISVASVYMLRGYVVTQDDGTLNGALNRLYHGATLPLAGYAEPFAQGSQLIVAIQPPGQQVSWFKGNGMPDFGGSGFNEPLPELPTATGWAGSANSVKATLLTVPAQNGPDSWRVIAQTISDPSSGQAATLVVATPLGNLGAMTQRLILFDLIVGAAIVVVLAAAGVAVVQANLRPLNYMEITAGQIAQGHLNHRVAEGDPRTEIGSLGRSLNTMLSQIESAFHAREASERAAHQSEERMRRFIADASHELRTPLTTIRGFAAHYRQRGGADGTSYSHAGTGGLTPAELNHLVGRVESEAIRMGQLVEDLLTLARLDQQRPLSKAPVDLLTVAVDAVQDARIVSPGRSIDLVVEPGTAFIVEGDEPRLRQVLANLVNNALTHTPDRAAVRVKIAPGTVQADLAPGPRGSGASREPGSDGEPDVPDETDVPGEFSGPGEGRGWGYGTRSEPMSVSAGQAVPAVVLDVEDDGLGMTADQAQRVFERFYRVDAARNRASGGTGLGLAIVASLVAAHGGTVSLRTAPGQGADFQVKLPLSHAALAADDDVEDDDVEDEPPA